MNQTKEDPNKSFDPFEPFRGIRDSYLESLSKSMVDAVNTEGYAEATGAMLDYYLTASAPFREAMEKVMQSTLQQLSLPSRQELASLAERFTNLEMKMDDLDAKLERILDGIKAAAAAKAEPAEREIPKSKKRNNSAKR